jgi:neutral amino acid transport system permease protein
MRRGAAADPYDAAPMDDMSVRARGRRAVIGALGGLLALAALLSIASASGVGAQEPTASTTTAPAAAPAPAGEPDPAGTGPSITTTLTAGDEPLEGVVVVVSLNGEEVGEGTSDADGKVRIPVPGPGRYQVQLDVDTLPEGVELAADARATLNPVVQATGSRPVVFQLVESGAEPVDAGPSDFERLASLTASGVRFGLVIALGAVGLSLIFGTTGLTNFAHGEMIAFGAIATWYLNVPDGGLGLPLLVAAVGGILLTGLFGASFELAVYRPLRRRGVPVVSQMVVSIGLAFALRYVFSIIFGQGPQQYAQYAAQSPTVELGPISLRPKDLVITAVAFVCLIVVALFLRRARLGTAIRAVSDNRDLSIASGIDDQRVILMVWVIAGLLAGLSGIMLASTDSAAWNMGQRVLLVTFAAVVLGGLGTTFGAMVGGLVVGVVSDVSTFWLDADLKIVVALATLVVVLLVRPQGIFGVKARTA